MCIWNNVGHDQKCERSDGKAIQYLLNCWMRSKPGFVPIPTDGRVGPKTLKVLDKFLGEVRSTAKSISRRSPELRTLQGLLPDVAAPNELTQEALSFIFIDHPSKNQSHLLPSLKKTMVLNGIDTPRRMAHFLAQVGHESGGLHYMSELSSGEQYEGRKSLGNSQKGDGARFKGRGLIQLTGRSNYEAFGKAYNLDLTSDGGDPSIIAINPDLCAATAGWFWSNKKLNAIADRNDLPRLTKKVNGGYNGFDDRWRIFDRAEFLLMKKDWPSPLLCMA